MKILIVLPMLFVLMFSSLFVAAAQTMNPNMPETMDEAKELGKKTIETARDKLPAGLEKIWKENVLPLWQKMYNWFLKNIWEKYIAPFYEKEIRKRQPAIEEEFRKEKEEMKNEIPAVGKSIWERFKDLIK